MHSLRSFLVAIPVALLFTMILGLPTTSCHEKDGQVSTFGETHDQAAGLARKLVKNTGVGTFMSVMDDKRKDGSLEGFPFGSMDYYVDDCDAPGKPLMLLSHLQINVQNSKTLNRVSLAIRKLPGPEERGNPMVDPRVTLLGHLKPLEEEKHEKAEACFLKQHPEAKWWLPRSGFHDFKWYNLEIKEIYYIGGFGGIHYIGWIDVETYFNQQEQQQEQQQQKELYSARHLKSTQTFFSLSEKH